MVICNFDLMLKPLSAKKLLPFSMDAGICCVAVNAAAAAAAVAGADASLLVEKYGAKRRADSERAKFN